MSGFRNAPSITEFAVGMTFNDDKGYLWIVMGVFHKRAAFCVCLSGCQGFSKFGPDQLHRLELDLDSIWVGRVYKATDMTERIVRIRGMAEFDQVVYEGQGTRLAIAQKPWFLNNYEPLPAPEPPVKVGEIVWIRDNAGDWFGRVTLVGINNFMIKGPHFSRSFSYDVTITKLVPEKEEGEPR